MSYSFDVSVDRIFGIIQVFFISPSIKLHHLLIHLFKWKCPAKRFPTECLHGINCTLRQITLQSNPTYSDNSCLEPLSPIVWLSHQRIQLGSLLLNIITLNKVAFLIFVSFCQEIWDVDVMAGEMFWSRKVYLFVKLCGLCLVPKLHLIRQRYKDD